MTRARNSANLASHGNLFVDIANDRTGIGSVAPAQNLHVAGTAGFHADTTFTGDLYNATWDRSDNSLKFTDNARLKFGSSDDLRIFHTGGAHSYISNLTNNLYIQTPNYVEIGSTNTSGSATETSAKFIRDGAVELYHNDTKKFETTAYGTNTTGTAVNDGLVVAGVATVTTMNVTGVLTYDDVTSIDSIGIITARSNIDCNGNLDVAGTTTLSDDLNVDSGTLFVDVSSNRIGINSSLPTKPLDVVGSGEFSSALTVGGTLTVSDTCNLGQTVTLTGTNPKLQFVDTNHNPDFSLFGSNGRFTVYDDTNSAERFRIDSSGRVLIGGGNSPSQVGDGRLIVYADTRLHPAIKADCIDGGSNRANGFTMLADNYLGDESLTNIGVSYSGGGLVLSRGVKVSNSADNAYLSSVDSFATQPCALKLDNGGNLIFLNTNTSATTTTDSAVTLYERFRIRSDGEIAINHTQTSTPLNNTFISIWDANSDSSAIDASGISKNYAMISLHNYGTGVSGDTTGIGFGAGSAFSYTKGSVAFQRTGSYGTGDLVFLTNNDQDTTMVNDTDERMRITRTGYVGINQSSPQTGLHINQNWVNSYGSVSVEGDANVLSGYGLRANGTYRGALLWRDGSAGNYLDLLTNGAHPIVFRTNGDERLRIDSSALTLKNNSGMMIDLQSSAGTGSAWIEFSDTDGTRKGYLGYGSSSSEKVYWVQAKAADMAIYSNGYDRFNIQSNGTKVVRNGHLNILSTYIDFSGSISTPSTAAAIFRPADNTLAFSTANNERIRITNGGLDPSTDAVTDLGNSSKRFRHLNLSGKINNLFETIDRGIQVENSSANSEIRVKGTGGNRADMMILQTGTANANIWLDASNGDLNGADYANIRHNNSTLDLEFINYAADILMKVRGGSLGQGGLRTAIHAHENGAVDLYHNGNKRFETLSDGVKVSGTTDGVLNLTTTDGRGSFIRFQQSGNSKVWVGSSEGFGIGDQDDAALMAVGEVHLMSSQTRRVTVNGGGMMLLYGGGSSAPWGATFPLADSNNSTRCFFTAGTTSKTFSIMQENGKFRISGAGTAGTSTGNQLVYLSSTTATSWTGGSDIRLKENITEIPNVLDKIKNYRCARFNFIGDDASDIQNIKFGFIAQDWVDDFPEVLSTSTKDADDPTDTTEYYGMQYTETIPVLLKAIQELNAKVETLQNEVNTLKSS